ncbi:MAG: hypothetical protein GY832_11910, partial [Chloroflexi bacterium]|nr:hypothetical protein [Chloroflexota bacterium]
PAIDSGLNSAITVTTDLDGNPRLVDGDLDGTATVDMGAYERQLCFVEANGDNSTDYSSDDASAIQQAVDAAAPGDVLKIAGRCAGVQTRVGLTQTVYISQALTLQGGYTYTNWLASPDLDLYASTLDAQGNGRVVYIPAGITVTISNLILINGSSDVGGGIYSASPLTVTSALIYSNTAGSNGGGLFLDGSSTLISNTHIYNNAAQSDGAGMYISGGTLTLNQSQVYDNHTLGRGNGDRGGAFYAGGATVVLERSAIYANSAGAGGAWVSSGGLITVAHSAIYQNDASYHPGMLQSGGTILTINNSTVSENGHGDEGAIRSWDHADNKVILIHSTIADNQGVGVEIFSGALVMTNTLLANNDNGNCLHAGGSISSRDYNISSDATCPLTATHDLTNTVPLLDTLADNGGESLTHALLHGSPAINHIPYGVNGCGGEFWQDQRGMTRPQLGQCDVGAYEMQPLCLVGTTLFVDQDAGGLQHGGSWADAYTDLQDGLFAAAACTGTEEIWVATGVYTPGATVNHTFQLLDGVAVYGGFAATETQRIQRDWQANPTVLSGDIGGDDTTDTDGVVTDTANITGTNSYHVVTGSGVT